MGSEESEDTDGRPCSPMNADHSRSWQGLGWKPPCMASPRSDLHAL